MLQQHSEKVRMKCDIEGFLPDENPWTALLSAEEEYAVLILVNTQRKTQDEAEYVVRGERLRRRPLKEMASWSSMKAKWWRCWASMIAARTNQDTTPKRSWTRQRS
jgi:hypothetical protein